MERAEAAADLAETSVENIDDSVRAAAASATVASDSATTAHNSATIATTAELSASDSASRASASASLAASYVDAVHADAVSAASAAGVASSSAIEATASKGAAQVAASNAQSDSALASAAASTATSAATTAVNALTTTINAKTEAVNAASTASSSSETARMYAQQCGSIKEVVSRAVVHEPTIGDNGNWWIWSQSSNQYLDSGVPARPQFVFVDELPRSGLGGVIYLVPNGLGSTNSYDEYIWISGRFEMLGTTQVDIVKKADKVINAVEGHFAGLDADGNLTDSGVSPANYYTKAEIDAMFAALQEEI